MNIKNFLLYITFWTYIPPLNANQTSIRKQILNEIAKHNQKAIKYKIMALHYPSNSTTHHSLCRKKSRHKVTVEQLKDLESHITNDSEEDMVNCYKNRYSDQSYKYENDMFEKSIKKIILNKTNDTHKLHLKSAK